MFEVLDQRARAEIKKRRLTLRVPHAAKKVLSQSLAKLHATERSQVWTLPQTKFPNEVRHYSSRHQKLGLKGPRPRLRSSLGPELAAELAQKIEASLNLVDLAVSADPSVKPVLLYYACTNLCGVYTRAFFEWEQDRRRHGLSCIHNTGNLADTVIKISERGQFQRLATACFLFSGMPSCFTELVAYSTAPTAHTAPGELLEEFGKRERGCSVASLTLDGLVTFDYGTRLKAVRKLHGFHKFKGLPTTAFLMDVITLFVGSSFARYDVLGWRRILEGRDNSYRLHFDEAFDRFQTYTIDALLAGLENPLLNFDSGIIPSQPSPYSHDDHSRFKRDPNYADS